MEVLECLKCKGQIVLDDHGKTGKCRSCETAYHFKAEKSTRVISLLNQANISRLRGDFDGAILAYKIALSEDETDADAYWGITLSKFGIEYVQDERTKQLFPTCRRTVKHSILSDEDYLKALEFASPEQSQDYQEKAQQIDRLQNLIKEKIEQEQDYDVFLCFKSTDNNGNPTEDRIVARNIYDELEKRGIKTFFSEITLKNRLGEDYEPIIYKALYTCKIFILVATQPDYIQAPWVRNEWSRFRDRIADEGLLNVSFAVFKDIKQSELPPIFRHQGVDLSKYPAGGYEIDIADNLQTRLEIKKFSTLQNEFGNDPSAIFEEKVVDLLEKKLVGTRQTYEEKLERALTYHEIGNTQKALEILEAIIDEYPRRAMGWFYKAELLTEHFQISVQDVHLNNNLKQQVLFAIDNATRFAEPSQLETIEGATKQFVKNLNTLEKVDQKLDALQDSFKTYLKADLESQQENQAAAQQFGSKQGYMEALEINDKKLKKLKRQVNNKNYYTKNIELPSNPLQSFFQFVGVLIILVAVIAMLINLVNAGGDATKIVKALLEFVLLGAVGFAPFILVSVTRKNAKLKQVKSYIENDRQEYENLKKENHILKVLISDYDRVSQQSQVASSARQQLESRLALAKKQIADNYKQILKLKTKHEFVENYLTHYDQNLLEQCLGKKTELKQKLTELEKEKAHINKQIGVLVEELKVKKPKYFSESYEKLAQKIKILLDRFNERIEKTNQQLNTTQFEIELCKLKEEKTVSSPHFLQGFLLEFEDEVKQFLEIESEDNQPEKTKADKQKQQGHSAKKQQGKQNKKTRRKKRKSRKN